MVTRTETRLEAKHARHTRQLEVASVEPRKAQAMPDGFELAVRRMLQPQERHFHNAADAIDKELRRRGPVKDIVVHGVHLIGDEISPRALELAKGYVKKMTRTPEAAAALAGTRLVIIPPDERITDQDLVFEAYGMHR